MPNDPQPTADWTLYGRRGWGSAIVEALLARCGVACVFEDVTGFDRPGPARDRLLALNPLAQVPTLVLPEGAVMTESVAIALLLAERFPEAGLAPLPDAPGRAAFLRRLVWLGAALYSSFTYDDYPERWVSHDQDELQDRVAAHRAALWREFEASLDVDLERARARPSAVDIFVSVMTRWKPRRAWFEAECPGLYALARAVDGAEALEVVWAANYPKA